MAEIPAGLLAFIRQPQQAMPSIASLIPKSAGRRPDPTVAQRAKQAYEQQQAEQAAAMFENIAGQQGQAEQIGELNEDIGGYDYTPKQQATGLFSDDPQRFTTAASEMIQSGNPMLQKQGMGMLDKIQAGAAPTDMSMAKTFAMGAPDNIVNGVNINAGKMIRAMPDNNAQGYKTFGEPYDPRNPFLDIGTGFVDPNQPSRSIDKNLEKTESLKRKGQLGQELALKPAIEAAITQARIEAKDRGESFTELKQAKAAMPNLTKAVDELKDLALVATSTYGGRAFDVMAKEMGFGSTKGANAKAKFIAIVNNQVLPLLKPTFGAAFTVQEGESLKATMGDPNSSPDEKLAQLDAFITQKLRDIETKSNLLKPSADLPKGTQDAGEGVLVLPDGRRIRKKQ